MAEENLDKTVPAADQGNDYQAPSIEEVVNRDDLQREVAYAGSVAPSRITP